MATAVKFPLLGIRPSGTLILLEGDQDDRFVKDMSSMFEVPLDDIQLLPGAKFKDASYFQPLVDSIRRLYPKICIRLVRDLDFHIGDYDLLLEEEAKILEGTNVLLINHYSRRFSKRH